MKEERLLSAMTESFFWVFASAKNDLTLIMKKCTKNGQISIKNAFINIFFCQSFFLKNAFCHCTQDKISFKMSYHMFIYVKGWLRKSWGTFAQKTQFWRPFCIPRWPPLAEKFIFFFFLTRLFESFNMIPKLFVYVHFLKKSLFMTLSSP